MSSLESSAREGTTSVSGFEHHLLSDHDDPNTYEGLVRESDLIRIKKLIESQTTVITNVTVFKNVSSTPGPKFGKEQPESVSSSSKESPKSPSSSNQVVPSKKDLSSNQGLNNPKTNASSVFMVDVHNGSYTSAISAIVGIGVCLLVLNLIIAAMYFKRVHQVCHFLPFPP